MLVIDGKPDVEVLQARALVRLVTDLRKLAFVKLLSQDYPLPLLAHLLYANPELVKVLGIIFEENFEVAELHGLFKLCFYEIG